LRPRRKGDARSDQHDKALDFRIAAHERVPRAGRTPRRGLHSSRHAKDHAEFPAPIYASLVEAEDG